MARAGIGGLLGWFYLSYPTDHSVTQLPNDAEGLEELLTIENDAKVAPPQDRTSSAAYLSGLALFLCFF
jgi:hypothetical protein